jgi:hypothetical protein
VDVGKPQLGESGEVDRGSEESEVGADTQGAAHSSPTPAVAAAYEVGEFAFDFGSGGLVVGLPRLVALTVPGGGEAGFVAADADAPAGLGSGAHVDQGAGAAVHTELGLAGEFLVAAHRPDGDGDAVRAGDGLGLQVDVELVLGIPPGATGGWTFVIASIPASSRRCRISPAP